MFSNKPTIFGVGQKLRGLIMKRVPFFAVLIGSIFFLFSAKVYADLSKELTEQLYMRTFRIIYNGRKSATVFYLGNGKMVTAEHFFASDVKFPDVGSRGYVLQRGDKIVHRFERDEFDIHLNAFDDKEVQDDFGKARVLTQSDVAIIDLKNEDLISKLDEVIPPIRFLDQATASLDDKKNRYVHITDQKQDGNYQHFFSEVVEVRENEIMTVSSKGVGHVPGDSGGPVFLAKNDKLYFTGVTRSIRTDPNIKGITLNSFTPLAHSSLAKFERPGSQAWKSLVLKPGHNSILSLPQKDLTILLDDFTTSMSSAGSHGDPIVKPFFKLKLQNYFNHSLTDKELDEVYFAFKRTYIDNGGSAKEMKAEDIAEQIRMIILKRMGKGEIPKGTCLKEFLLRKL